jgi:hypothetical protein
MKRNLDIIKVKQKVLEWINDGKPLNNFWFNGRNGSWRIKSSPLCGGNYEVTVYCIPKPAIKVLPIVLKVDDEELKIHF